MVKLRLLSGIFEPENRAQVRMAEDSSEEPFLSSLKAFATRTCIANSQGKPNGPLPSQRLPDTIVPKRDPSPRVSLVWQHLCEATVGL